jgi:hypothetical protein
VLMKRVLYSENIIHTDNNFTRVYTHINTITNSIKTSQMKFECREDIASITTLKTVVIWCQTLTRFCSVRRHWRRVQSKNISWYLIKSSTVSA